MKNYKLIFEARQSLKILPSKILGNACMVGENKSIIAGVMFTQLL